jgi:hypothetical protein
MDARGAAVGGVNFHFNAFFDAVEGGFEIFREIWIHSLTGDVSAAFIENDICGALAGPGGVQRVQLVGRTMPCRAATRTCWAWLRR